ncbi:hypothetical protein [Pseudohaliea sp.]|uniref:phenylacetate--CoA ligase family protein n=1 Tax=Pseudohaliea sp. TaxID=2740289 RepID=UPI0032F05961
MAARRTLERSQWQFPEALLDRQLGELRVFLERIGRTVPHYRELFEALEFRPSDLVSLEDLQRLPLLDKATIRGHFKGLHREGAKGLMAFNTGGSSGEPLTFMLGRERVSHDVAAKWRATRWWGVDIGDPEVVLWGSPIELGAQDRIRQLRDRLLRTELLSAFEMSADSMDQFLHRIRARRPLMLFGYPSSLALLAKHVVRTNQRMDDLGIRVAFVTSERLFDYQREAIEQAFGCPVANGYGGRDAGFIAHACPAGSLHVTAEDIVVEVVDGTGRALPLGSTGEIVVTHLRTGDFPFVRYRTGDLGKLSSDVCDCGRGLPVLASVEGRSTDFLVTRDGTTLHGLAFIYILREMAEVEAFRVVQESLELTRVQVVPGDGFDTASEKTIVEGFRKRLGEEVDVQVDLCSAIPSEASGKFRYVQSRVSAP